MVNPYGNFWLIALGLLCQATLPAVFLGAGAFFFFIGRWRLGIAFTLAAVVASYFCWPRIWGR